MSEFRFHGNAWDFEKKLREAMKRAQSSGEFRERFARMARMVRRMEISENEHPIVKADFPVNFN
ncbi:MAG TPA: hypothetical protein VGR72_10730 [Candidatus Acidoferrales bacterium]|nr:hypothetical protein [Candidatus Acidoferrales bacterium]